MDESLKTVVLVKKIKNNEFTENDREEEQEERQKSLLLLSSFSVEKVLGLILPAFIVTILTIGAYIVNTQGRIYLFRSWNKILVYIYLLIFDACIIGILSCFWVICISLRSKHSVPPKDPPKDVKLGLAPFLAERPIIQQDQDGPQQEQEQEQEQACSPRRCYRGSCKGAWVPLRARHCPVCERCRVFFDHCCPWIGTDVSRDTLPPFIILLSLTPLATLLGLSPFLSTIFSHFGSVYSLVYSSSSSSPPQQTLIREALDTVWFGKWYSWALGPVWHYFGAIVYVYLYYQDYFPPVIDGEEEGKQELDYLDQPSLLVLGLCVFVIIFGILTMAMLYTVVRSLYYGRLSMDDIRQKHFNTHQPPFPSSPENIDNNDNHHQGIYVFVPLPELSKSHGYIGAVLQIHPLLNIYNLCQSQYQFESSQSSSSWSSQSLQKRFDLSNLVYVYKNTFTYCQRNQNNNLLIIPELSPGFMNAVYSRSRQLL